MRVKLRMLATGTAGAGSGGSSSSEGSGIWPALILRAMVCDKETRASIITKSSQVIKAEYIDNCKQKQIKHSVNISGIQVALCSSRRERQLCISGDNVADTCSWAMRALRPVCRAARSRCDAASVASVS